jgi:hypothetical protein
MVAEVSPGGLASTALSLTLAIMQMLVKKGTLTKQDGLDIFDALIEAKDAKTLLYESPEESEAAELLIYTRQRFLERC